MKKIKRASRLKETKVYRKLFCNKCLKNTYHNVVEGEFGQLFDHRCADCGCLYL